jgi:hypothetical protein
MNRLIIMMMLSLQRMAAVLRFRRALLWKLRLGYDKMILSIEGNVC